jgi:predicted GIY-YIG superfamily endonuclease
MKMWYVYIIKSNKFTYKYIGSTNNLYRRLTQHNNGECEASKPYKPFELIAYIAVKSKDKAIKLEKYLKTGSGAVFLEKRIL